MARKLNEIKVGEYRTNWFLYLIHVIFMVIYVASLIFVPLINVTQKGERYGIYTPLDYLIKLKENSINSMLCLFTIIFGLILFLNVFICFALPKVGRSWFMKFSKFIEAALALIVGLSLVLICMQDADGNFIPVFSDNMSGDSLKYMLIYMA